MLIVHANDYWNDDTRYCYVAEFRHWIVACVHYYRLEIKRPMWSYQLEVYTLGFCPPNHPLPVVRTEQ